VRKALRYLVLTGLLTITGCSLLERASEPPVAAPNLEIAPPPPVKAEQITAGNARDKARQLHEEIDRDASGYSGK
jgi:hypothetical protein